MTTQVKILSILFVLFGLMGILGAFFTSVLFGLFATIVGASDDGAVGGALLGLTGIALSVLLFVFALPSLAAGYGLWKHRSWGRILAIILGAIALIKFPVGTLFGVYALFVLFNKDTEALFTR
jgi:hypothetical protein